MRRLIWMMIVSAVTATLFACGDNSSVNNPTPSGTLLAVGYDGAPDPANARGGVPATNEYLVFFDTAKLAPYVGQRVVGLRICYADYSGNPATLPYVVKLYGDSGVLSTPGAELFSQSTTFSKGWNDVMLASPVTITSTTKLWAAFQVNMTGVWPLSFDNLARVPDVHFARYSPFTGVALIEGSPNNLNVRLLLQP